MLGDTWDRIQDIFLQAADLHARDRSRFLDRVCDGDTGLRSEVESLLRADGTSPSTVEAAIEAEALSIAESITGEPPLIGVRLGSYRIIQEIGRGGVGAVYLAERDDDQFHKLAAIKVVKRGMDTDEVLGRFRHERQILADLEHPYISRLLDGGTTADGRPFFVMERVEGRPIDAYCREHNLNLASRLQLFLKVCEAVSHAHRALVVHRDLKPGNILVTREGVPKLLDFGVAKLLAPGADPGLTSTLYGVGPLTPEYASPEQVRGGPVTTATDVYALGAILYELLTGERAQKIDPRTPTQIDRVVCEIEPLRPSLIARGLNADLDNIVRMAMRKEPERRYASVDQLADDIRRFLDGRPVAARKDSFLYRASKFTRRHRLSIAAAVLVFGTLIAGIAISLNQARQALASRRQADAQRQTAERERARAEAESLLARTEAERSARRLTQMVELADRSLYDVHSAVEKLPGSTEARRQIVATTLQFLENLSKDAGEDDSLRLVLSAAYMKAADVQGLPIRANLGDSQSALANYRKSAALVKPLLDKEPGRVEYLMQWIDDQTRLAYLLDSLGNPQEAIRLGRLALPAAEKLVRLCPAKLECLRTEADLYDALTFTLRDHDATAALGYSNKQIHSLQQILKSFPANDAAALDLATAYSQAAVIRNRRGELRDAVDLYHRAIDLREQVIRRNPADAGTRRLVMITYGNLAGTLGSPFYLNLGDTPGALENYSRALAIARELATADPDNQLAEYDLANALLLTASLDLPMERWADSLAMLHESDAILQKLVASDPQSVTKLRRLAMAQEYEGRRLQALGKRTDAVMYYRQSLAIAERALARNPSDPNLTSQALADEEALAAALALDGNRAGAVEIAQKAVARAERVSSLPGSEMDIAIRHRAEAYRELGAAYAAFGEWKDARAAAERAVSAWRQLAKTGSKMVVQEEADRAEKLLQDVSTHLP